MQGEAGEKQGWAARVLPLLLDRLGPHAFPVAGPLPAACAPGAGEIVTWMRMAVSSQPLRRSLWKNLNHPASACHPGPLGQSMDLTWQGPFWKKWSPCSCGNRGAVDPPPPPHHAVTLVLLRLDWDGEVRCTLPAGLGGPERPTRPVNGQFRPLTEHRFIGSPRAVCFPMNKAN